MDLTRIIKYNTRVTTQRQKLMYFSLGILPPSENIDQISLLQRSLDKQNKDQNPQINFSQKVIKHQKNNNNKLWTLFLQKIETKVHKIQKDQIDYRSKLIDGLIQQSQCKIINKRVQLSENNGNIQKKYRQSHSLYQELKQLKNEQKNYMFNMKLKKTSQQKKISIKQQILLIEQDIKKYQNIKNNFKDQLKLLQQQKLIFLRNLLKNGIYRIDGVKWILQKLNQLNYTLDQTDLPDLLDKISKQCLLKEYSNIKNKNNIKLPSIKQKTKQQNSNKQDFNQIFNITNNNQLKKIYKQAGRYLVSWLHNEGWKNKKKKMDNQILQQPIYKWKEIQKKRIKEVYSLEQQHQISRILFGIKNNSQTHRE